MLMLEASSIKWCSASLFGCAIAVLLASSTFSLVKALSCCRVSSILLFSLEKMNTRGGATVALPGLKWRLKFTVLRKTLQLPF